MAISPYIRGLRDKVGHELLLLPGVSGVVFDGGERILLGRRADTGAWAPPAGAIDPGEEPAEAMVREVLEETGVVCVVERLLGVATYDVIYPNQDHCQYLTVVFRCRAVGGTARVNDDESTEVAWFATDQLPDVAPAFRQRIALALDGSAEPWFARPPAMPPQQRPSRG